MALINCGRAIGRLSFNLLRRRQPFSLTCSRHKEEEEMDQLAKNPYYNKYADKIAKLQKTSPQEFLNRLSATESGRKKSDQELKNENEIEEKDFSLPSSQPKGKLNPSSSSSSSSGMIREKKLDSIMKTQLLTDKSQDEISAIWGEYHRNKDAVSAVIPSETYKEMKERFQEYNTFLFPLPRKQGYEFVLVQFSGNEAHFTTLINFQAYHENAPECLTIVHYPELSDDKGIVLMVGEFDKNVLTIQEAQCLANQVEMYYFKPNKPKLELMNTFLNKPNEFKHTDLINQMENISLNLENTQTASSLSQKPEVKSTESSKVSLS